MEPVRSLPFGTTRSRVTSRYALITPDTHVRSPLVGWRNASAVVHISPEMGARFTQYTATLEAGAASARPGDGVERFVFVLEGNISLSVSGKTTELSAGHYAYLPAGTDHQITTDAKAASTSEFAARLVVFEKLFQSSSLLPPPQMYIGNELDRPGEVFQGDPALRLQTLLPIDPAFDMAANIFTYDSGGHLPQVEVHVMEHGLLMLEGTGVYRLDDDWFPVQAGDVIWMASYCPQWFVAMGKQPAKYLYYKDIHRDRLNEKM
jgi:(S)-ureidoglycine aminohydrolase